MSTLRRTNELLENARYSSPTEIEFILKRPQNRMRGVTYSVETHSEDVRLNLAVSPNGNMTASIATDGNQIADGEMEAAIDMEPVFWADTENPAIIRTSLGLEHIAEDLPAGQIVKAFLDAITVERHAIGRQGYFFWNMNVSALVHAYATHRDMKINVVMEMPRTICPGLENMKPWHMPKMEFFIISDDDAFPFNPPETLLKPLEQLSAKYMPRASALTLRPPFLVRSLHTESFLQEPGAFTPNQG